ncbi:MAG: GNAT family N-acetyltransferase [Pirellulales bacterium]|nr:GNAT family N-acetyltransferase [Pirellulales bacterium]
MPRVHIAVDCPVYDSFRVAQVAGMFDVPAATRATAHFECELPDRDEVWDVGLVVGPSGSGKSTVAAHCYGEELYRGGDWPHDKAVVDCFDSLPLRQVVELLTAVGFSSPPSWIKPYQVLSYGERFRCDLARALSVVRRPLSVATDDGQLTTDKPLVVFDEYTSVVDRQVARASSAAIAKAIRRGAIKCRFIAVTCHYDVAQWLQADWVLDMTAGQLSRRHLRRPPIDVQIHRCGVAPWRLFARHHYLSGRLAQGARCYLATWEGEPVTFCATLPVVGRRRHRRFTRIVTLPDYQGMGIGTKVVAAVASLHRAEGLRINVTSSHPALVGHCRRSPDWKSLGVRKPGPREGFGFRYRSAAGRAVASFEYIGA